MVGSEKLSNLHKYLPALVHSDCCSKNTVDWVACKRQKCILRILDSGKSMMKVLADSVSDEGLLPVTSPGVREFSETSFIRARIRFMRDPPLWLNNLPKAPPPNRISAWVLGRREHWVLSSSPCHMSGGSPALLPLFCVVPVLSRTSVSHVHECCHSISIGLDTQEAPFRNIYFVNRIKCNVLKQRADCS